MTMKTSKRISILILLSLVYHRQAKATFPVDNIRVSFTFPSIAVMDTPKTAWYMFALAFKVWMMALYLGLPRVPARRPIREMSPSFTSSSYFQLHTISRSTMTFYLDAIVDLDKEDCISRMICHMESLPRQRLSAMQKIFLDIIWSSASSSWNFLPFKFLRKNLVAAAYFGKITQCSDCCRLAFNRCLVDTDDLLQAVT